MKKVKRKLLALAVTATLLFCTLGTSVIASGSSNTVLAQSTSPQAAPISTSSSPPPLPSSSISSTTLSFADAGLGFLASKAVSPKFSYSVDPVFSILFPDQTGSELTQIQSSLNTIDTQLSQIQNSIGQLHNEINELSQSTALEDQINDFYDDDGHFSQYESAAYACITEMNYIETLSGQAKLDEEKQFLLAFYSKKQLNGSDFCRAVVTLGEDMILTNSTTNDNLIKAVDQYVDLYNTGNKGKAIKQDFKASIVGVYTILSIFAQMSLLAAQQEPNIQPNSSGSPISTQLISLHNMNKQIYNLVNPSKTSGQ